MSKSGIDHYLQGASNQALSNLFDEVVFLETNLYLPDNAWMRQLANQFGMHDDLLAFISISGRVCYEIALRCFPGMATPYKNGRK